MKPQLPELGTPLSPGHPACRGVSEAFGLSPLFPGEVGAKGHRRLCPLERRCEQGIVPPRKNPLPLDRPAGNSLDS